MFKFSDIGEIILDPNILIVPEFEIIYNKYKENSRTWFKFIYFYCDYKSPYNNYSEEDKKFALFRDLFKEDIKEIPIEILNAIDKYNILKKSPEEFLLEAGKEALYKVAIYIKNTSVDERKLKGFLDTIKNLGQTLTNYSVLKDAVEKEKTKAGYSQNKKRGNREVPK